LKDAEEAVPMNTLHREITNQIVADFYDQPIMSNLARPHYVERMIALGLSDEWRLVSANWSGWDIESRDGVKVEVKQSAARQVWTSRPSLGGRTTKGQFDIGPRTGYWAEDGSRWVEMPGRPAHIYIFAWHPVENCSKADHRDATQWKFYVVPACELPASQKSIGLKKVAKLWSCVSYNELQHRLSEVVADLSGACR
jgi:hypothetical protein